MWQARIETLIYQHRRALSSVICLIIIYFIMFSRLAVPAIGFFLAWEPETRLVVIAPVEEAYREFLQPGDVVLAVEGKPVRRGDQIFPFPLPDSFELTLQRDGQVVVQTVPNVESQFFRVWELSNIGLALAIWFLGFLTTQFARPSRMSAVLLGLGFQLTAAGILSAGPTQLGLPGAWVIGYVLIYYFPLIILYASLLPRYKPFSAATRKALWASLFVLSGLALLSAYEHLVLFPERSLADLVGVRNHIILTVLTGASLITAVIILTRRMLRLPRLAYERQQLRLLLVFFGLAVSPLFFFVILPATAVSFAPYPFIYSFLLLIPAGYFFMLHRQGYLALDRIFSQVVTVAILILFFMMAYATGAYLLTVLFQQELDVISQGFFALLLFGVAFSGQKSTQTYVALLTYGRYLPEDAVLKAAQQRLAAEPEAATVTETMLQIASHMQVAQLAVLTKQEDEYTWLAGNTPAFTVASGEGTVSRLRSRTPEAMGGFPDWVELSLPILVGSQTIGLFLLAAPVNGYFNGRQVQLLQDVTGILASSLQVLSMVEILYGLLDDMAYEKEMSSYEIATEIHNRSLQRLTDLLRQLEQLEETAAVKQIIVSVQQFWQDLQRITSGMRPRILVEPIHVLSRQLALEFGQNHEEVVVDVCLHIDRTQQTPDLVKRAYYHVLTEALNNIGKHAQASRVEVTVRYEEELTLIVEDDGIGPGIAAQSLPSLVRHGRAGVVDMHQWARIAGGRLKIRPRAGGGTVLVLVLPRTAPERRVIIV